MAILNNLYPPVVNTYMPAFLIKDECRIYFSLSSYNTTDDIRDAQISLVDLNTNLTVLNTNDYPSAIKLATIHIDETKTTDDKYYVIISNEDLEEGFEIDTYYKAQIRFTGKTAAAQSHAKPQAIDTWLAENLEHFSEWSTICLIRGISTPDLTVSGFEISGGKIYWSLTNTNLIGKLTFEDSYENETLKSYRIRLYRKATDELLTDSGDLYTSEFADVNSFIYTFKYNFEVNASYYFTVDYTTTNLYSDSTTFNFTVVQKSEEECTTNIDLISDKENGRIGVVLKEQPTGEEIEMTRKLMIRRTSSNSNFTIWEDIHYAEFIAVHSLNSVWYDTTIESGVWYKYCIQNVDEEGYRGPIKITEEPIMVEFSDMFLTVADKQLRIQFNPNVSSFKKILSEFKVDTLGSQYPFIRRNGYTNYAQFPISGLISGLMDEDKLFVTDIDIYGSEQNKDLYQDYNNKENIKPYNDFIYEKKFRDLVMNFLYNSEPKLFRSPTEGNVLVKIMDVNLSPETVLSRMIWTFSGTAYEIANTEIATLEEFNILNTKDIPFTTPVEEEYEDSIR